MDVLTSKNSPLNIASVLCNSHSGRVGMTLCPGKHQPGAVSGSFQRDLALDLDAVKEWGATAVVTLQSQQELAGLNVASLGAEVENRGMLWFQLPMANHSAPDEDFERLWVYAGVRLRGLLRSGQQVLVHCGSGLGRTGLIAARLLIELGTSAKAAIASIREARPGTLKDPAQAKYLQSCTVARHDAWMDRVLGCLLGGAVGDAFGYAVEFDSLDQICTRYGGQGLTKPVFHDDKLIVSDDTQMTLFTLEALLRCTDRAGSIHHPLLLDEIRNAYLDWYETQLEPSPEIMHGWLADRAAMHARRAPGNTCLSALKVGGEGTIEAPVNDSKGCGGVMRTAPIGFLEGVDLFDLGARAAALTHGHVDGWAHAGVVPRIVSRLIKGENKFLAVRNGFSDACEWGHVYGKAAHTDGLLLARKLAIKMRFNPRKAISLLGQGWVGDEALAIAMYAFLTGRDYTDTVIRATNHDGDSDSTASIAGQFWGAKHGLNDIPHAWIRRLDVLDEILTLAQAMQGWHRDVGVIRPDRQLVPDEQILPCIRMLEMAHELHVLGYQRVRIFPYFSAGGAWRVEWTPLTAYRQEGQPPQPYNEREVARYSCADGWAPFNWEPVESLSVQEMAWQFVRQFPELIRAGEGGDWEYAGWLTRLLGEVRKGRLPYFIADWSAGLTKSGVPMTQGDRFPLPPFPAEIIDEREEFDENPEDDEDFEIDDEPQKDGPVLKYAEASGMEFPEPAYYDFTDPLARAHGLVMLYHHGTSYLLPVTQTVWQLLPEPRDEAAAQLSQLTGWGGGGKLGLYKLLEKFLLVADDACAAVAGLDEDIHAADGGIDWKGIEQSYEAMDEALLKTAYRLSLILEQVIHP